MHVGNLEVEVTRDTPAWRLRIQGHPFGLETPATADELRALAAYLLRALEQKEEE